VQEGQWLVAVGGQIQQVTIRSLQAHWQATQQSPIQAQAQRTPLLSYRLLLRAAALIFKGSLQQQRCSSFGLCSFE
jgi:hypothetical protein